MSEIAKLEDLQDRIIEIRGQQVLLDADVAQIYGVETRDINKAVSNNPDKFPEGYILELSKAEKNELVENFHRFKRLKHSTVNPKAFPEKGLYMLATILKNPQAMRALNNSLFRHSGQAKRDPESGKYLKILDAGSSPA
jgi:hypothetical protein